MLPTPDAWRVRSRLWSKRSATYGTSSEQRCADVEAKLVEGALTAAGHAVGILKSYTLGLDISVISCGYNCNRDRADELFNESWAALEPFVERLNLSVSDEEEE
jgi:hypothetical protein